MGHPSRLTRADKRAKRKNPDEEEKLIQRLSAHMRFELKQAPKDDGVVAGPLAVAAHYAAEELTKCHELEGEDHLAAVERWLLGHFGDVIRQFDPDVYLQWRDDCRRRALAVVEGS